MRAPNRDHSPSIQEAGDGRCLCLFGRRSEGESSQQCGDRPDVGVLYHAIAGGLDVVIGNAEQSPPENVEHILTFRMLPLLLTF